MEGLNEKNEELAVEDLIDDNIVQTSPGDSMMEGLNERNDELAVRDNAEWIDENFIDVPKGNMLKPVKPTEKVVGGM